MTASDVAVGDNLSGSTSGLRSFGIRLPFGVDGPLELSYQVLDSAPIGMALIDPSGTFHWANEALCRLLARSRDDMLQVKVSDVVHADDLAAEDAALAAVLRGQRSVTEHNLRCLRPDGATVWASVTTSMATGPDGAPLRIGPARLPALAVQVLDITDRRAKATAVRELQRQLEERNDALERSNRDLVEVASILSHDLAEPLRVIAGHVRLLADRYSGQLDADADSWIDFAVDGCMRMRNLIDAVLAYSMIGRDQTVAEPIETGVVVDNVCRDLSAALQAGGIELVTEGTFPSLPVPSAELGQIFSNLILNAIRHGATAPNPRIVVRSRTSADTHLFEVEDNGPGIPEHHRERIFHPFQRLQRATDHPGTGIGLAICRKSVEKMGGSIGVTDAEGEGSLFWFTIPRKIQ